MTDNPWQPIDTMPLGTVGTTVDLQDKKSLYSGVLVSGIRHEREVITEREWGGEVHVSMGDIDAFTITHTRGAIHATTRAQWRPHV